MFTQCMEKYWRTGAPESPVNGVNSYMSMWNMATLQIAYFKIKVVWDEMLPEDDTGAVDM